MWRLAARFVAGDLSGIQGYILGVRTVGKAQAKRLRARSFHVEIFEHAALGIARDRLGVTDDKNVLLRGGGGFLLRTEAETAVHDIVRVHHMLERRVLEESSGELRFSMGWGTSAEEARAHLELAKRQPLRSVLCNENGWNPAALHRSAVSPPCGVCGRSQARSGPSETLRECRSCAASARLGERLTQWSHLRITAGEGPESMRVLGVAFGEAEESEPGAFRVRREVPRQDATGELLTFEEIAAMSTGTPRLAVLKADVDDMGLRVRAIAASDPTHQRLRRFSAELHGFFCEDLQDLVRSYGHIYTLFAGGDDLLLVGPWDVVLHFAGTLHREFGAGPGQRYPGITLSAGIALARYRVPVRHAVERAEELLKQAKGRPGKDRCAGMGAVWRWARHQELLRNGDLLARAIRQGDASRAVFQRLLTLLEAPTDHELRAARWDYQVARAKFRGDLRTWAYGVLGRLSDDGRGEGGIGEADAILRYALLATRGSDKEMAKHAR